MKTFPSRIALNEQRRVVAYLDSVQARLASHKGVISLRKLQSQTEGIGYVGVCNFYTIE